MGIRDWLFPPREKFSQQWSISDPAFAAWLRSDEGFPASEAVTAYTVLGLSAVQRAVAIISTTIASLPLKTYERGEDGSKAQVESVFDDPYPGIDGMPPFAWIETVLTHLLIWRQAFLWHEARADGSAGLAYRPIIPDTILRVKRVNGRRVFEYKESGATESKEVGSEQITYIPGPSLDGTSGHPLLWNARAVFSSAISGDKTIQRHMRKGIRIAGIVTPRDPSNANDDTDFDKAEGDAILESLRATAMGSENAGDIALINRRVQLDKWTPTNIESQWHETLMYVLMQIEQLFGVPPHLMADTEKQTSWGTGVAEQNLSLARFTLRGWSDRLEQVLSMRLPQNQFVEFDYKGLLQGTPEDEIKLLIEQTKAGILEIDEARKVMNLPPLTPAQKTARALALPRPVVSDQVAASNGHDDGWRRFGAEPVFNFGMPDIRNEFTVPPAPVTVPVSVSVEPTHVTIDPPPPAEITINTPEQPAPVVTVNVPEQPAITLPDIHVDGPVINLPEQEPPVVNVTVPEQRPVKRTVKRNDKGQVETVTEEPVDG